MAEKTTWTQVMELKKKDKRHQENVNTLTLEEIDVVAATVDFCGGAGSFAGYLLFTEKLRVFDFLGQCVHSKGELIQSEEATKVMAFSFIRCKGNVTKWVRDLATTDYDMSSWRAQWEPMELGL